MGLNVLGYPSHLLQRRHPIDACGHEGSVFPSLPGSCLMNFYRDASSALLQLVNQWLNFTYSRSHVFRYGSENTKSGFTRIRLSTNNVNINILILDSPLLIVGVLHVVRLPNRPHGVYVWSHTSHVAGVWINRIGCQSWSWSAEQGK